MLTDEEARVLGCLVEKQLATPQQYPLSEAALVAACNQTTNRDPIVSYGQGTVRRALIDLRQQGLARLAQRPGERAPKHRHRLDEALGLEPPETALLGVLLLRGPQTVGELRTRAERLHRFATLAEVEAALERLAARADGALVERLARVPGQKEGRYRQLLQARIPADEETPTAVSEEDVGATPRMLADLLAELRTLREGVAELRRRLDELQRPPS